MQPSVSVRAVAEDAAGNIEPRPHVVQVRSSSDSAGPVNAQAGHGFGAAGEERRVVDRVHLAVRADDGGGVGLADARAQR